MRATLTIDDKLRGETEKWTGIAERNVSIRRALAGVVQRAAGQQIATMGGRDPDARASNEGDGRPI